MKRAVTHPEKPQGQNRLHATCVAIGNSAALIRGPSGSGKSDLAYRFINLQPQDLQNPTQLVADDQVLIEKKIDGLIASPPPAIAGKIEVRGIGILDLPHLEHARLSLIVDLVQPGEICRLPERAATDDISGVSLPLIKLAPFEASAPLKLRDALLSTNFSAT